MLLDILLIKSHDILSHMYVCIYIIIIILFIFFA